MSEVDAAYWDEIQRWKATQTRSFRPRVISMKVRSLALSPLGKAVRAARRIPGGATITENVASVAQDMVELAASASEASVRRGRILKAYRDAGHRVEALEDIRQLSLDEVLEIKPQLTLAYSGGVAAEGALSGVVSSGASVAAVLGMGVLSAPGVGVTASAIALDVATFLAAATRLVAHTAAYYGYDSEEPSEKLFSAMVLSQAIDPVGAGRGHTVEKQTTMLAFSKVMRGFVKRGSFDSLGEGVSVAALNTLVTAMGVRLAARKVAQIIPVAGIVVGAGMNAALMRTIGQTTDYLYRERFLSERYNRERRAETSRPARSRDRELRDDIASYVDLVASDSVSEARRDRE